MFSDVIIIALTFTAMLIVCGVDAWHKRREYLNDKEVNGQAYFSHER
jgi:hypothetical protein